MNKKFDILLVTILAVLATWIIFAAMPYFRLRGNFPQVDTQIIFLHGFCSTLYLYQAMKFIINKDEIKVFNHELIIIPFLLVFLGITSSLLANNTNTSFYGSAQIGQGVFWYFDLAIMSVVFSQVIQITKVRWILFFNLLFITVFVSFFTFYPEWRGLPISFYYFTDYLCFYGVLTFIMFTTLTKNNYLNFSSYLVLGGYLILLDNLSAVFVWFTSLLVFITYYLLKYLNQFTETTRLRVFLFSNYMFVFIIFFFSFLTLLSSLYFWPGDYMLPFEVKDTLWDSLVVRGKLIENTLMGLNSAKNLLIGMGWGIIPDIIIEHMSVWQYDQLRLGTNLHFHTHNELAEHFVSLGLLGGTLFMLYMFFIFKYSEYFSFISKLGWLVFFKINCFWFLWTGTLPLFALVVSCFISFSSSNKTNFIFLKPSKTKQFFVSNAFVAISIFLIYGSYSAYHSTKVFSSSTYGNIIKSVKANKKTFGFCEEQYKKFNRGGQDLEPFLNAYSSYLLSLDKEEITEDALTVLQEVQCIANKIVALGNESRILLSTAMLVDGKYYFKLGFTKEGKDYFKNFYDEWYMKALIIADKLPKRGDLMFPFLSYAINNNKTEDAVKICKKSVKGIEGFCDIISAYQLLESNQVDVHIINKSVQLIKKAIDNGVFNELLPIAYWQKRITDGRILNHGVMGIPLSPSILYLISEEEKIKLEGIIRVVSQ